MCGKAIPASDDTYVHDAELKNDFIKISEVLRLFPKTIPQAEDKIKNLETAIGQLENENIAFKTRIDMLQKNFQALKHVEDDNTISKKRINELQKEMQKMKVTMERLYPSEVKRCILNEKGEIEEYTETFDSPEGYIESERKFVREVLLRNKSKKERERLKNAVFVLDKTGKMTEEDIEAEVQRLRKKKAKE